ncbi:hypothetical protein JKP88DRAFT_246971 [Tribonema minus]|uniref:Cation efflux protein cytoplasmic domain-containing protein n=1 Tax=Tribonema minus TaxID=303371 RepID=A0A836CBC3_9STRA|nr:hypothetical protein JKP88DRAFT_246971 [Tribonema minus]
MSACCLLGLLTADLIHGLNGDVPSIDANATLYVVLGGGTLAKFVLWCFCMMVQPRPDVLVALAEDHLNDVVSNVAAIATAAIAGEASDTVDVASLELSSSMTADVPHVTRRADSMSHYRLTRKHLFWCVLLQMEVILPADTVLSQSHDIALELQHKLEAIEEVERAFVHVDYMKRACPEHKVERKLLEQKNERVRQVRCLPAGCLCCPGSAPAIDAGPM